MIAEEEIEGTSGCEECWPRSQAAWVGFPALPLTACVILVETLDYQAPFLCKVGVSLDLPPRGVRTQGADVHTDLRRAPGM